LLKNQKNNTTKSPKFSLFHPPKFLNFFNFHTPKKNKFQKHKKINNFKKQKNKNLTLKFLPHFKILKLSQLQTISQTKNPKIPHTPKLTQKNHH